MAQVLGLRCVRCDTLYTETALWTGCPACAAAGRPANVAVAYDLDGLRREGFSRSDLADEGTGLWRYSPLLPVAPHHQISLGEGATPLLPYRALSQELGIELFLKDESRNPTWSYKDRLAAVAISQAVATGARGVVTSSTGNHGAATAAYAAAAGLPCVVLTMASVPETMKTLMQSYGARLLALERGPDRWVLMAEMVRQGWTPTGNFVSPPVGSNPYGVEGYKTIAFEIAAAWDWQVPDWVVVPTSYGDGLYGTYKGFAELHALGLTDRVPKMVAAEVFGPLAHALEAGLDYPEPVPAVPSVGFSIATPMSAFQALLALRASRGTAVRVDDPTMEQMQLQVARQIGLYAEVSSAASVAAAAALARQGVCRAGARVVCIITSSGLKDPGATRRNLPPVPVVGPDPALLAEVLRS